MTEKIIGEILDLLEKASVVIGKELHFDAEKGLILDIDYNKEKTAILITAKRSKHK